MPASPFTRRTWSGVMLGTWMPAGGIPRSSLDALFRSGPSGAPATLFDAPRELRRGDGGPRAAAARPDMTISQRKRRLAAVAGAWI